MNPTFKCLITYILVTAIITSTKLHKKYLCNLNSESTSSLGGLTLRPYLSIKQASREACYFYISKERQAFYSLGESSDLNEEILEKLNLQQKVTDFVSGENDKEVNLENDFNSDFILIQVDENNIFECKTKKIAKEEKQFENNQILGFIDIKYQLENRNIFIISKNHKEIMKDIEDDVRQSGISKTKSDNSTTKQVVLENLNSDHQNSVNESLEEESDHQLSTGDSHAEKEIEKF